MPTVPWEDPTQPVPAPNDLAAHDGFVQQAKRGHIKLLFLGDSITYEWDGKARALFHQTYDKYEPAVFAVPGDKTQNLLWRIDNGELDGIQPKVIVLMIGANNVGLKGTSDNDAGVVAGVAKVVDTLRTKLPATKILLMGILPMGEFAYNPARQRIRRINSSLAALDDGGKNVRILDIGNNFLDANDDLPPHARPGRRPSLGRRLPDLGQCDAGQPRRPVEWVIDVPPKLLPRQVTCVVSPSCRHFVFTALRTF